MKLTGNIHYHPTDDLITFWRSKFKVTTGSGEGVHIDAGASQTTF